MTVRNDLDRFHLVGDVIDRVPKLGPKAAYVKQTLRDKLIDHKEYIEKYGDDLPEIKNWKWGGPGFGDGGKGIGSDAAGTAGDQ
jgi:xylulose-5-phosphate/fructose-6-phosphate phosphoketolase